MRDFINTFQDAIDAIDAFEEECEKKSHTDTGEVWDLLHRLYDFLVTEDNCKNDDNAQ